MMGSGESVSSSSSAIEDTLLTSSTLHGPATVSAVDVRNMGGSDTGLGGEALGGEGDASHASSTVPYSEAKQPSGIILEGKGVLRRAISVHVAHAGQYARQGKRSFTSAVLYLWRGGLDGDCADTFRLRLPYHT